MKSVVLEAQTKFSMDKVSETMKTKHSSIANNMDSKHI